MKQDNKLQKLSEDEQKGVTGGVVIHDKKFNLWIVMDDQGEIVIETIHGSDGEIRGWWSLYFSNQEEAQRFAREHGYSDQVVE